MILAVVPITTAIAGAAALMNLWLAIRVGQYRTKSKIMLGDGGDPQLIAHMRAHANYVEYTPFILILILVLELRHGPSLWLWAIGAIYIVGRICHAIGMTTADLRVLRAVGTAVTMLTLLGLAVFATYTAFDGSLPVQRHIQA